MTSDDDVLRELTRLSRHIDGSHYDGDGHDDG